MQEIIQEGQKYVMNTYNRVPIAMSHGEGVYIYDVEGKKYLDMCAGIAVNALGYQHTELNKALKSQIDKLLHISNLYYIPEQIEAAKILIQHSCFSKVFFCNSGAEANEAALKLAKKYGKMKNANKTKVITMSHSFHGRTYGALGATGQIKYQKSFSPMLEGFTYAEYNNIESVKALIDEDTCAILLEVIQGEGGIIVGDPSFLKAVEVLCKQKDILFIIDEVQTGIGRTGKLFAFEHFGIEPDIVTLAKGLGGGVPIGAMLCKHKVDILVPTDHATTFGGNPLATTAAKVVLKTVLAPNFLEEIVKLGEYLHQQLEELKNKYSIITAVRGIGLMQGIELNTAPKELVAKCIEKGMLVVGAGENVVRFVPPLIINKAQISTAIDILEKVLKEIGQ